MPLIAPPHARWWMAGGLLFAVSRTMTGDIRYYRFRYNPATRGSARRNR